MFDGINRCSENDVNFKSRTPYFEQLFNLEKGPQEKNNLFKDYEGKAMLSELRKQCRQKAGDLNDRRSEYKKTHKVTKR